MDKALKQRLVGAVVLIALAVIVLPMIFGGRPATEGSGPSEIEIPAAPPDLEFETRRFPVGDQSVPQSESRPATQPASQPDLQPDSPAGRRSEQVVDRTPPENPLPVPDAQQESPPTGAENAPADTVAEESPSGVDPTPVESGEGQPDEEIAAPVAQTPRQPTEVTASALRYVVQVASFGSTQNATRLAGQLEEAGYAVLLDHVSSDTAQLNRVRVGPYASEAAAQGAVRELRERFAGVNPRIVDLQPDQASPAIASDDPLMRWVVQVGSFSSSENAQNLVARLRLAGMSSYDEAITNATSTIYRVRVGPFLDREEAIRVEQQIAADMGIDGVVMSAD